MTTKELCIELTECMGVNGTNVDDIGESILTTIIQYLDEMKDLPMNTQQSCVAAIVMGIIGQAIVSQDGWYDKVSNIVDDQTMGIIDNLIGLIARLEDKSDSEEDNG